jgi:5'-phosphate synthase pdxT subunit
MRVGVLALQGGFAAHVAALARIGVKAETVRYARELDDIEGLVLPGGESTTQLDLLARGAMRDALAALFARGAPVLATCAGLILAASTVEPEQNSLGWLDVDVCRNGYGRQTDSFVARDDSGRFSLPFIRAPRITRVGPSVEVLATCDGEPVLVRQGAVVGATFHPELTPSEAVHRSAFLSAPWPSRPLSSPPQSSPPQSSPPQSSPPQSSPPQSSPPQGSRPPSSRPLSDEGRILENVEQEPAHLPEHVRR